MLDTVDELLNKIRLGEDSFLELKEMRFSGQRVRSPNRTSLADEIAAFGNSAGGVLVLGVADDGKEIPGIPREHLDTAETFIRQILNDAVTPPLYASILKLELPDSEGEKKPVIKVEVPRSLFVHQSPGGYFHRVGSAKREMEPATLARLFQQRSQARVLPFDEQVVPGTSASDLSEELWRPLIGRETDDPMSTLRKMKILAEDAEGQERLTVSGVLFCTRRPSQWLRNVSIEAVRYRGASPDANYQLDAQTIEGPLNRQIEDAVVFVRRNTAVAARKDPGRIEYPEYDLRAVFEAIVNAVAHRDYSIFASRIRLFIFDDRLELYSPGALPNSVTVDSLHLRQSTRNELVTSLLQRCEMTDIAADLVRRSYFMEKRGEGVPIILSLSEELSGKRPKYQMIDDAELLLTIWAAKHEDTE